MKRNFFILSIVLSVFLSSCTTTLKSTQMQMSPVSPVLNIGSDKYDIIGAVEGTGTGITFEMAKDAAIGAAVTSKPDADALIFPKFETSAVIPLGLMVYLKAPVYTVVCKAKAIKLK